jgi:hypothetical protein
MWTGLSGSHCGRPMVLHPLCPALHFYLLHIFFLIFLKTSSLFTIPLFFWILIFVLYLRYTLSIPSCFLFVFCLFLQIHFFLLHILFFFVTPIFLISSHIHVLPSLIILSIHVMFFSSPKTSKNLYRPHILLLNGFWVLSPRLSDRGVKLTTHLQPVPRLRMSGATPPLLLYTFMTQRQL